MVYVKSDAIPENPSSQLQVTLKWVEGMANQDWDAVADTITDDFVQSVHPANLGFPDFVGKDNFFAYYKKIMSLFIEYTAKILEIIEGDGKVVIHAKGDGKTVLNYDYANEYIWVFHVIKREDGRYKVSYIKDFVDSYFSAGFTRASQEAIAKAK